jgi:hypothetical protein
LDWHFRPSEKSSIQQSSNVSRLCGVQAFLYVLIDSPSSPRNFARSVFTTPVRGELWPDQEEIIGALLGDQPIQSTASKSSK